MRIVVTNDVNEVRGLVEDGHCPVECSVGGESIVDELAMDHHGVYSHLESVAIRAYRDHYGARKDDPRFVIVGTPDADATFCVAALAGVLPHPSVDVDGLPVPVAKAKAKDLTPLAETIAKLDVDLVGHDVTRLPMGEISMAWQALMAGTSNTGDVAVMGVMLWVTLTAGHPARKPLLDAGVQSERRRIDEALLAHVSRVTERVHIVDGSKVFGFDVWYQRDERNGGPGSLGGWGRPVVLALSERYQSITIGCPNKAIAEMLFGPGGLKNVFPKLDAVKPGWGGRETVGGSPRGVKMTSEDLRDAARVVSECIVC